VIHLARKSIQHKGHSRNDTPSARYVESCNYTRFSQRSRFRSTGPPGWAPKLANRKQRLRMFGWCRNSSLLLIGRHRGSTRWLRRLEPSPLAELTIPATLPLRLQPQRLSCPRPSPLPRTIVDSRPVFRARSATAAGFRFTVRLL